LFASAACFFLLLGWTQHSWGSFLKTEGNGPVSQANPIPLRFARVATGGTVLSGLGHYSSADYAFGGEGMSNTEQNKENVRAFYDLAFNQKQPEEAMKRYASVLSNGLPALIRSCASSSNESLPKGDLVVVHSHNIPVPGTRGKAVIDIFRVENGKIVEHWDVVQEVPEAAKNNNTMF
jgi:predicted SnoaL-like aldol condensation-catalyzing enzyme